MVSREPIGAPPPARSVVLRARIFVALAWLSIGGCHRSPTYYEDVRPILAEHCAGCHRPGGVAPTPRLGTFEEATRAAGKIRSAVKMRDMPPWGAENTGLCGKWTGALWLSDAELRTLVAWTESPARGDSSRARPDAPPKASSFRASGAVLDTGGDFRPGLGPEAYRCYVTDPRLSEDAIVTAFRAVSTEPRSVAHVAVYASDSPRTDEAWSALDAADPELGYSCYGSTLTAGARLLTSFNWDGAVSRMPPGFGVKLRAGRKAVVQIHYDPIATGLGVATRTRVELEIDRGAREATYLRVSPDAFALAPRSTHVEARTETTLAHAVTVLGVVPRMHSLGRAMELDRAAAGDWRCTANFDHWSFYRQRLFVLESPLVLDAGARLRLSCAYDTESHGEPTHLGDGIEDEECRADLLVADR